MTTNYIDGSLHVSSFPTGYLVPGLLRYLGVTDTSNMLIGHIVDQPDSNGMSGYFTASGNATVIACGFGPTYVKVVNWTDGIQWEWLLGAPATDSLKTNGTGPTVGVDTTSELTVTVDAMGGVGDVAYVTIGATAAASGKILSFRIQK